MEAYLDNAATTRALPEVAELVAKVMTEDYGNPSSLHGKGFTAEKYIRTAAEQIAATMKVDPGTIVFTSGGTESNNQALIGTALALQRSGKHIITTGFEHASVAEPLIYLEKQGFEITFLPVGTDGRVAPETLKNALREDTILVSIMMVNNEIGVVQDIDELVKVVKDYNPEIRFHTDAIQAYGKLPVLPKKLGIDLLSVSGHKLHGPKGTGFLYIKDGNAKLHPYIHGGHQQKNRRSGTENVPGIAGLGLAAKMAYEAMADSAYDEVSDLSRWFISELTQIEGVIVHGERNTTPGTDVAQPTPGTGDAQPTPGAGATYSPYIISVGIEGIKSEVLLHALEDKEIYVSSGSACSSNHPGISDTLTAIGVEKAYLDSTIRFSLSRFTTKDELTYTLEVLQQLLPTLRRFTKR
ncbi:MAG: cysteine desulfurase family protein [Eubacterium sp.]|nr:cysteine desulfurase family protein [Eubacterium sp.]